MSDESATPDEQWLTIEQVTELRPHLTRRMLVRACENRKVKREAQYELRLSDIDVWSRERARIELRMSPEEVKDDE